MKLSIEMVGLKELRAELKRLPVELNAEARDAVRATSNQVMRELLTSYPVGKTGNLRAGVKQRLTAEKYGTNAEVQSTAPHAHLWEFGTINRKTEDGWRRGQMKGARARGLRGLIAIAIPARVALNKTIWAIIERSGTFRLSGAA